MERIEIPREIHVDIPPQDEIKSHIYCDSTNCYLAEALKEAGYKNVCVGPIGRVSIERLSFISKENFSYGILKANFESKKVTHVTLIRS